MTEKEKCAFNSNLECRKREYPINPQKCLQCFLVRMFDLYKLGIERLTEDNPSIPINTSRLLYRYDIQMSEVRDAIKKFANKFGSENFQKRFDKNLTSEEINQNEHLTPTV